MIQSHLVEEFMTMRAMTRLTGQIYEGQVEQLKRWPKIAMPNAKKSLVDFEINDEDQRTVFVTYEIDPEKPAADNFLKRMEKLEKEIQWLLGNNWLVVVEIAGEVVFKGRRRAEPRPRPKQENKPRGRRRRK